MTHTDKIELQLSNCNKVLKVNLILKHHLNPLIFFEQNQRNFWCCRKKNHLSFPQLTMVLWSILIPRGHEKFFFCIFNKMCMGKVCVFLAKGHLTSPPSTNLCSEKSKQKRITLKYQSTDNNRQLVKHFMAPQWSYVTAPRTFAIVARVGGVVVNWP